MTTLVWFRLDLRLADQPALAAAASGGEAVVPVFLWTPAEEAPWAPGAASRWWLHRSLASLDAALEARGSRLILRAGPDSLGLLQSLVRETGARRLVWNRRYEPAIIARDRRIKAALEAEGLEVESFNAALLHEPWTVTAARDAPYQVFGAFWRQCRKLPEPAEPLAAPAQLRAPERWPDSLALEALELEPRTAWASGLAAAWTPGSAAAEERLQAFLESRFQGYGGARDRPGAAATSQLSPHLHFGEIGPRQVWHAVRRAAARADARAGWRDSPFLTEIGWREFAYHLLFHFPHTPEEPLRARFARFPWEPDAALFAAWSRGATGYPIIDAGMRELWRSGFMHNRVRMLVASFLVKDLLQPWSAGARWFWDTLVDADLASNTLGWQWSAGSGADAVPYFRIFNPVAQALRFDADGRYVRHWVPELARLPDEWLHEPWSAPPPVLERAGVHLGETYPQRIVLHESARQRALAALARMRDEG